MRLPVRTARLLIPALAMVLLCVAGASAQPQEKPNVLFILTDDMRADDLFLVPEARERIAERGARFDNSFVTTSVCCPSRATLFTGKYVHNHGVWSTRGPDGGEEGFRRQDGDTLATRLQDAGYRTGLIGKYLNGYGEEDASYVPPGWDSWFGYLGDYNKAFHHGTPDAPDAFSANGTRREISQHDTDYMARKAEQFVGNPQGKPWFLLVSTNAPHGPSYPAPRHEDLYPNLKANTGGSYDEADVSDKPGYVRELPRFDEKRKTYVDQVRQKRARSLASVSDLVRDVTRKLAETGQLHNTYVVFTSDNGFTLGQHRIATGKQRAYEEHVRVPLLIRGPDVPRGETRSGLVANTDWGPTVLDWAGADVASLGTDGRSLTPLISDPATPWRERLLLEFDAGIKYDAVREESVVYTEHGNGERELYDLAKDPHQLQSRHDDPAYADEEARLSARLDELRNCSGQGCRDAENGAVLAPPETTAP